MDIHSLQHLSPALLCCATAAVSVLAGLMPCSPFEPMLIGVAAVAPRPLLLPLALLATASQMGTKALLFLASAKAEERLGVRTRRMVERAHARLANRPVLQRATILSSGVFGLPPFYVVTVASGALRLRLRDYLLFGSIGRGLRFAAIMSLPRLFM